MTAIFRAQATAQACREEFKKKMINGLIALTLDLTGTVRMGSKKQVDAFIFYRLSSTSC